MNCMADVLTKEFGPTTKFYKFALSYVNVGKKALLTLIKCLVKHFR